MKNVEKTGDPRIPLSFEEAMSRVKVSDGRVHTFRSAGPFIVGLDLPLSRIEEAVREFGAEEAGENAQKFGHGVAVRDRDQMSPLFIETNGAPVVYVEDDRTG